MESSHNKIYESEFEYNLLPALLDFIKIPNLSPAFDPAWETNGLAQKACEHIVSWIQKQLLQNIQLEIIKDPGKTHLVFADIAPTNPKCNKTVLMYAHIDKQPPMEGRWEKGLSAFNPVIKDGKLYGRGSSDDGYAPFSIVLAIKLCQMFKMPHPRILLTYESAEESLRDDLAYYIAKLRKSGKITNIDYVICMDAGAVTLDRFWVCSSLRGIINFELHAKILEAAVHSGDAGGIVPETFRILRELLNRIEDVKTGKMLCSDLNVEIPEFRRKEIIELAKIIGDSVITHFPWIEGSHPEKMPLNEYLECQAWKPALHITGADGLPHIIDAGNVLRAETSLKLSLRLPPIVNAKKALEKISEILLKDPPYGAKIEIRNAKPANGWHANEFDPKLDEFMKKLSKKHFGNEYAAICGGGGIPFISMLSEMFPKAVFIVTGAAPCACNAHAPNEFLELGYLKKYIPALTEMISEIAQ